jgi:hypothetical protein
MTMGTSSWSEHSYLSFCLLVFSSCLKFFSSEEKIILFRLGGFLLVRKGFSIAARVTYSAYMFLKLKTVCLHGVIPEMCSFSMRPAKYFYDKPLLKCLDPKTNLYPHPVVL